jgi:hypothetical protein
VRFDASSPAIGGGLLLDDPVAVNSLEPSLGLGADAQGPLVLVAWEDAREGAGTGKRSIHAQLLRTDPTGFKPSRTSGSARLVMTLSA